MIYEDWGLSGSPFQTTSLPATELGQRLLVGRDTVLRSLIRRIESAPKLATLEGLNGVGKTSVVNVAAYQLYQRHIDGRSDALYIPCRKIFQLNPSQDTNQFIDGVLMEVAQTLIKEGSELRNRSLNINTAAMNRWLNAPQLASYQGGLWIAQFGQQSETNTSSGFERSGFRKMVVDLLESVFPEGESGGVICTIDNLELLQSSDAARAMLEQLRDELFNITGLRWVLCGSLGIVFGVVSSPRLEGYLHTPIEVGEIDATHASDILTNRILAYSHGELPAYLPLTEEDFKKLYGILRGNLRSVLSHADNFCQWIADGEAPPDEESKHAAFEKWLNEQACAAYDAVRQELRPKAIEVFKSSVDSSGVFSPSDFEAFGFNSIAAFRPHIKDLESVGVLVSTQDDGDRRRKTIQVTPKGWMVDYHMSRIA